MNTEYVLPLQSAPVCADSSNPKGSHKLHAQVKACAAVHKKSLTFKQTDKVSVLDLALWSFKFIFNEKVMV